MDERNARIHNFLSSHIHSYMYNGVFIVSYHKFVHAYLLGYSRSPYKGQRMIWHISCITLKAIKYVFVGVIWVVKVHQDPKGGNTWIRSRGHWLKKRIWGLNLKYKKITYEWEVAYHENILKLRMLNLFEVVT